MTYIEFKGELAMESTSKLKLMMRWQRHHHRRRIIISHDVIGIMPLFAQNSFEFITQHAAAIMACQRARWLSPGKESTKFSSQGDQPAELLVNRLRCSFVRHVDFLLSRDWNRSSLQQAKRLTKPKRRREAHQKPTLLLLLVVCRRWPFNNDTL